MDSIDHKILLALKENGRRKASDISHEIHLSVSSVIERIRKLEASGIIQSYTVILDDNKIGNDLTVLMEVSLEHPRFSDPFVRYIRTNPHIISCYYLTGEFDYMLKICCRSSRELEEIHREIKQQEGVRLTKTHYALSTEKNNYSSMPDFEEENSFISAASGSRGQV
ncbi:MAG: Lrp/AsnC family transcriptional regulator [Lachnospiraceae bacterium]|nr:Lrp/AsnC family transcriptional regulator [Lachnospiraceae bacterium]